MTPLYVLILDYEWLLLKSTTFIKLIFIGGRRFDFRDSLRRVIELLIWSLGVGWSFEGQSQILVLSFEKLRFFGHIYRIKRKFQLLFLLTPELFNTMSHVFWLNRRSLLIGLVYACDLMIITSFLQLFLR